MGGFWLSAMFALANRLTCACGAGLCVVLSLFTWTVETRPAAWQAWQWVQDWLDFDGSGAVLACISQSAGMADAAGAAKEVDALFLVLNMVVAGVFIALDALKCVAAISVAIASPIQPRRGSRAIMRMKIKRRMG
jgi:hypothetical protein